MSIGDGIESPGINGDYSHGISTKFGLSVAADYAGSLGPWQGGALGHHVWALKARWKSAQISFRAIFYYAGQRLQPLSDRTARR
jgi:hypothetical protein